MTRRPIDRFPLLLAAASALVLGAALAFEHVGGLEPCTLCLWQRWPYGAAIALAAPAAAAAGRRPRLAAGLTALAGLALVAGAAIAGFHVGVEQRWWPGLASCGGAIDYAAGSVAELRQRLLATPVVRCDRVAWSLLGLSMAGWNFLVALGLGAAALAAAGRLARAPGYDASSSVSQ